MCLENFKFNQITNLLEEIKPNIQHQELILIKFVIQRKLKNSNNDFEIIQEYYEDFNDIPELVRIEKIKITDKEKEKYDYYLYFYYNIGLIDSCFIDLYD